MEDELLLGPIEAFHLYFLSNQKLQKSMAKVKLERPGPCSLARARAVAPDVDQAAAHRDVAPAPGARLALIDEHPRAAGVGALLHRCALGDQARRRRRDLRRHDVPFVAGVVEGQLVGAAYPAQAQNRRRAVGLELEPAAQRGTEGAARGVGV